MKKLDLKIKLLGAIILTLSVLVFGCSRRISTRDADTDLPDAPPTPKQLTITIDDSGLSLSWAVDDTTSIMQYYIHRSDSTDEDFSLIDSSAARSYTDTDLRNGIPYSYKVSSVDSSGFEGYASEIVTAIPEIYGIIVNNNDNATSSLNVTLTMIAPSRTRYMMVANDSLFEQAVWETYTATRSWKIEPPDGEKRVYARFRDADNNRTAGFKYDSITLDRNATIDSVTENSGGQVKSAGNIIRFTIYTGEADGDASVDIGQAASAIRLFDDGTNGDSTSGDGIYSLDYTIPPDLETTDAVITGRFTDEAGNIAPEKQAPGTVDIHNPPEPVILFPPVPTRNSLTSIDLNWSPSGDDDFAFYRIYRDTSSGVDTSSAIAGTITAVSTTEYADTNLSENTFYHYRIYVHDQTNLKAASNEDSARTGVDQPPDTVTLNQPYQITVNSMVLDWSQARASDFSAYHLYRAEQADFGDSIRIAHITGISTTTYTDTGLVADSVYRYKVAVYDRGGNYSMSNQVSGRTLARSAPDTVNLFIDDKTDSSVSLYWTRSTAGNFQSYNVYRSEDGFSVDSALLSVITAPETQTYDDIGLMPATKYYYRILVYNTYNLWSASNIDSATTNSIPAPTAVTLYPIAITDSSGVDLYLQWTRNNDPLGFDSYRLYMKIGAAPDSTDNLVALIDEQSTTSIELENYAFSTEYYFRVYVYNRIEQGAGSNAESITTPGP